MNWWGSWFPKYVQRTTKKYNFCSDFEARSDVSSSCASHSLYLKTSLYHPSSLENSSSTFHQTSSSLFAVSHIASPFLWKALSCSISTCIIRTSWIPPLPWAPTLNCGSSLFCCMFVFSSMLWAPQGLKPGIGPCARLSTGHTSGRKGTMTARRLSS